MTPQRINLTEKFTTFLGIYSNNNSRLPWLRDRTLNDNFQKNYNLTQENSEEFWIQYWLQQSRHQNPCSLAHKHLVSYLEETAYWVAKKHPLNSSSSNFSWIDLMQVARVNLLNKEKFSKLFNKYDSTRGSFTKFAQYKLETIIYEFIHLGAAKRKYSDAGLLRAVTITFLREALINAGVQDTVKNYELSQCLFVWRCFNEIYVPKKLTGTQRLEWASQEQLELIANRYNQLLSKPQEDIDIGRSNRWLKSCVTVLHNTNINSEKLNKLLLTCVKVLRNDISPTIESLDQPLGQSLGETQITLGDTLETHNCNKYEEAKHEEEELQNQEWDEIKTIIVNAYEQLSQDKKKMLQLEFGLSIKQQEIAKVFKVAQTTVSRTIKIFLKEVTRWSQEKYNVIPNPKQVKDISKALDACLMQHFKSSFSEILSSNFPQKGYYNVELFKLHYEQKLPLNKVAERLNTSQSALQEIINNVKQQLRLKLSEEVQKDLPIPLNSLESANQQILAFIDTWIRNAPYDTFGN